MSPVLERSIGARSVRVEDVVGRLEFYSLCETLTIISCQLELSLSPAEGVSYTASSNFFAAKALFPSALKASAIMLEGDGCITESGYRLKY